MIPGINMPQSQVPFLDMKTGLVNREWYRFLLEQYKYFGTMATQNADDVAITGGVIDATVIGGTTPAAGTFTTLTIAGGGVIGGTYTPTAAIVTNLDSVTAFDATYIRVGSAAVVSGRIDANVTAAGLAELSLTLPVASNFSTINQASGTATIAAVTGETAAIRSNVAGDVVEMRWTATSTVEQSWRYIYLYEIR